MSEEITAIRALAPKILFKYLHYRRYFKSSTLGPLVTPVKLLNLNEKDKYHLISLTLLVLDAHTD